MERGLSLQTGLIPLKGSCFFFLLLLWRTGYKLGMVIVWVIWEE